MTDNTAVQLNENNNTAKINFLIYMAADNNLEKYALDVVSNLRSVGSNEQLNILVLLDRSPGYDSSYGNWSGTKLFRIRKGSIDFIEDELVDCGEMDMTDPHSLEWFLEYVSVHFKAEKTILSIWSHGNGVYADGIVSNESGLVKSIIMDNTTGGQNNFMLSMQDLEKVLKKYPVEVLIFDACLMSMIEIIWQISDYADYLLAFQVDIPAGSFNYSLMVLLLINCNYVLDAFLKRVPEYYISELGTVSYPVNITVMDLKFIGFFKNKFCALCDKLSEISEDKISVFLEKRSNLYRPSLSFPEYCDLRNFLAILSDAELYDTSIRENSLECTNLLTQIIVSYNERNINNKDLSGISVNIPFTDDQLNRYIAQGPVCKIYLESNFSVFLKKIVYYNSSILTY